MGIYRYVCMDEWIYRYVWICMDGYVWMDGYMGMYGWMDIWVYGYMGMYGWVLNLLSNPIPTTTKRFKYIRGGNCIFSTWLPSISTYPMSRERVLHKEEERGVEIQGIRHIGKSIAEEKEGIGPGVQGIKWSWGKVPP